MPAKMLPRDPIAAELIKARWLLSHLDEFCGAAHFELPSHDHARSWSPSMYRIHGFAPEQPVPDPRAYCARCVAPDDRPTVLRAFEAALHRPGSETDVEYAIVRPDGTRRLVRALLQSFALEHGAVVVLGVLQDLTDREFRHVEPVATSGRLATLTRFAVVGEMAAGLAHEINQPLAALGNYASAAARLAATDGAGEKLRQALTGVAVEVERATGIVRRMRSFVRLPLGDIVPVDADALVRETLPLLEPLARRHAVALHARMHGDLPPIHADPVALQLALLNLACNAIEASAASGLAELSVEIATGPIDDGIEIVITDRGVGLAPGAERQLFMPFYTTKTDAPGLGLAITRSIVAQHAGRVAVEQNSEGGVTARVSLPGAARTPPASTTAGVDARTPTAPRP